MELQWVDFKVFSDHEKNKFLNDNDLYVQPYMLEYLTPFFESKNNMISFINKKNNNLSNIEQYFDHICESYFDNYTDKKQLVNFMTFETYLTLFDNECPFYVENENILTLPPISDYHTILRNKNIDKITQ